MKQLIYIIVITLAVASAAVAAPVSDLEGGTSKRYQHDMDIARLNDLKVLGGLIEEYHQKKGKYPLQGNFELPNYVFIATKDQMKYIRGGPSHPIAKTPVLNLIKELEKGLVRKIQMPFDPQKIPTNKPAFYLYMIHGKTYYLSVHLHNQYAFTRKIGPFYNKLEVSNQPYPPNRIWGYQDLMKDAVFIKATTRKMFKPGYVKKMRAKMYQEGVF